MTKSVCYNDVTMHTHPDVSQRNRENSGDNKNDKDSYHVHVNNIEATTSKQQRQRQQQGWWQSRTTCAVTVVVCLLTPVHTASRQDAVEGLDKSQRNREYSGDGEKNKDRLTRHCVCSDNMTTLKTMARITHAAACLVAHALHRGRMLLEVRYGRHYKGLPHGGGV